MYSALNTNETYMIIHTQSNLAMEAPNLHNYSFDSL